LLCALIGALALACMLAPQLGRAHSQAQRGTGIDTYAITNARIVTVAGPEIPRGTVVVRDGLIAAVGANTNAPADARIIDGTGLTVYPGLIDANTTLGMPQPSPQRAPGGGGGAFFLAQTQATPAYSAPNSTQPPGLQPEIVASDLLRPGGDQIDAAHNAGVTAALTVPREGIFVGQSAFVNLAGDTPQQMIVRSPVALHVQFTPLRTGGFPNSLMGVFAAIRQMFLDAERLREWNAIYARNPRGVRRPDQDKSLQALWPALAREMPVVMYADEQREIERALDLAQEFKLRAIIAGGMANMSDFLANAAKTVDNGLARDEAIRAMTIRAAEIFDVDKQLGTIEPGKIANLTVTRGDLFDRTRRISYVFIDGRPVDLRPVPAVPGGGAGAASGTWSLRVTFEGQPERAVSLTLQQQGEQLRGSIQGDYGSGQISNASVTGNDIKFTV